MIEQAFLFQAYVRLRRADRTLKAGVYQFIPGEPWSGIVDALSRGRVVTVPMTVPEGWTLAQMAPRLAEATGLPEDTVRARLFADSLAERWQVPGPGLEGYLFPDTYRFTPGAPLASVLKAMSDRYHSFWTSERRQRLEQIGLSEREAVTLASIVQAEARDWDEMATIAAVYLNRVRRRYPLQARPHRPVRHRRTPGAAVIRGHRLRGR